MDYVLNGCLMWYAELMSQVFGYTVAHDVSARDWQLKENGGQWLLGTTIQHLTQFKCKLTLHAGKAFDCACPLGPVIVTPEEFDAHNAKIRCLLNGETVQDSSTNQLIFKTEYLIHWVSKFVTLTPGDIILTGTVNASSIPSICTHLMHGSHPVSDAFESHLFGLRHCSMLVGSS